MIFAFNASVGSGVTAPDCGQNRMVANRNPTPRRRDLSQRLFLRDPSASLNRNLLDVSDLIVPLSPCRGHAISIQLLRAFTHRSRNTWIALTLISRFEGGERSIRANFLFRLADSQA